MTEDDVTDRMSVERDGHREIEVSNSIRLIAPSPSTIPVETDVDNAMEDYDNESTLGSLD